MKTGKKILWTTTAAAAAVLMILPATMAQAGLISGTFGLNTEDPTVVSDYGSLDWAVYGANGDNSLSPYAQKDDGNGSPVGLIPSLGLVGGYTPTAMSQWDISGIVDMSWTGGTAPNASATASQNPSLNARGVDSGDGLSLALPADTQARRAYIFVSEYNRVGEFTASLSDASAADYDYSWSLLDGEESGVFVIDYQADSAGQSLTINWIAGQSNNPFSNVGVQAVALQAIPEPTTMALLGLGGIGVLVRRRRQA